MEPDSVATPDLSLPDNALTARVSVILCARNRPAQLARAIESVYAQSFQDFELIVVNHGFDSFTLAERSRSRLITIGPKPTGAARMAGLNAARGSYIAYCDDFDTWAPDHLLLLTAFLDDNPTVGVAYGGHRWVNEHHIEVDEPEIELWPGASQTPFIAASAIMHRVTCAQSVGGFDAHVSAFSLWDLCIRMSDWWVFQHLPAVSVTQELHPDRDEFLPAAIDERNWIAHHAMGRKIRFPRHRPSRKQRRRVQSFDPETWVPGRKELDVRSVYSGRHSYASVNAGLLPALEREGVSILLGSLRSPLSPEQSHFGRPLPGDRRMTLFYEVGSRPKEIGVEPLLQYTMFEQDFVPRIHVEEINNYVTTLMVPCMMNAETFRRSGVAVPIQVLPHGVDSQLFPLLTRPHRETYTFGTFGQQNERKGVDVLLRAFRDEFATSEPVRLILSATMSGQWLTQEEARVEVRSGFLTHQELIDYLRELDAMVLPSRGEGFGLCGLEAMSTGLPLIATNWSGPADYLSRDDTFPLEYELVETGGHNFGGMRLFGRWAEPSYEHLRSLMRWLYEHRDEGKSAGTRAAERVHRDWTWERPARQIVHNLDLLAAGASPISDV